MIFSSAVKLEEYARTLAVENETILIYTGPVILHNPKEYIGDNQVGVFSFNYKMLVNDKNQCKGYVMPNSSTKSFIHYQMDCNFINYVLQLGLNEFEFWF